MSLYSNSWYEKFSEIWTHFDLVWQKIWSSNSTFYFHMTSFVLIKVSGKAKSKCFKLELFFPVKKWLKKFYLLLYTKQRSRCAVESLRWSRSFGILKSVCFLVKESALSLGDKWNFLGHKTSPWLLNNIEPEKNSKLCHILLYITLCIKTWSSKHDKRHNFKCKTFQTTPHFTQRCIFIEKGRDNSSLKVYLITDYWY